MNIFFNSVYNYNKEMLRSDIICVNTNGEIVIELVKKRSAWDTSLYITIFLQKNPVGKTEAQDNLVVSS